MRRPSKRCGSTSSSLPPTRANLCRSRSPSKSTSISIEGGGISKSRSLHFAGVASRYGSGRVTIDRVSWLFAALVVNEQIRELLFERFYLGAVADEDVRVVRIVERVVLVIVLGAVEAFERHHLSD